MGVRVAVTDMDAVLALLRTGLEALRGRYICVANVHTTVTAWEDASYRAVQNGAALVLPDGAPLSRYSRAHGFPQAQRVTGPDLMREVLRLSAQTGWTHYFYGSTPETLELLRQKPHAQALCSLRLEELFLRISRSVQDREDLSVPLETKAAFTSVRTKIHLNYSHPWKVEEMARLLHLSPSRFYQLYQMIFGVSPKQDLHMIRLEHAKNLLIGSRYTVQEIAEMVGYTNQYYFIRSFRSTTGKTPGQYRKCN